MAAVLVAVSVAAFPARASAASVGSTSVCIGTMTLSFDSTLKITPGAPNFTLTGSANCVGLGTSISWSSTGIISLDATCEDILASGQGLVSWGNTTVTMLFAGPMATPTWTAVDATSGNVIATGAFAWVDPGAITNCLEGVVTTSVQLTGAFAIVA